eukprot:g2563.t1
MFKFWTNPPKKKTPAEMSKEWTRKLRREMRQIDRDVKAIERAEEKLKRKIKETAKRNKPALLKPMAKELVNSRKTRMRMITSKAHLNSVSMQIKEQKAMLKMSSVMKSSTQAFRSMNALMNMPKMQATIMAMSKEMAKAGFIEEQVNEAMGMMEDDDLEEKASEQVNQVMMEIVGEQWAGVGFVTNPDAAKEALKVEEPAAAPVQAEAKEENELAMRLEAL